MIFFVDLDGTLKTDIGLDNDYNEIMEVNGRNYHYAERPHVKEFIYELSKLGDVYICTAASQAYAIKFVEKFGVQDKIKKIYSRDTMNNVPEELMMDFVFIDNDYELAKKKVYVMDKGRMSFGKKQIFITAKIYYGEENDGELLSILDACTKLA